MASRQRSTNIALGGVSAFVAAAVLFRRNRHASRLDEAFFRGKHILITGGSRGLGFVLAGLMLEAGSRVTICGREQQSIDSAVASFERYSASIYAVACDVRDRTACAELVRASEQRFGAIDVLINNAGIIGVGAFEDQTYADFAAAMDAHFWAPLYTMSAVLGSMRSRRSGRIANVASVGGVLGVPHLAPYSASKFAQIGLSQAAAAEVASDGVKITSVIPGLMLTGSPDHALFKGRHRAEYAWFTISDANPLLSTSAKHAARRIMHAVRRGDAQVVIGWTAQLARILAALMPNTTARLVALAAAVLPRAGGIGTASRTGAQSHSRWTQNVLTTLNRIAMRNANQ
jgi:NAD(P)-dependent dehydrogenase (short-subunit alcohol dehydrogenase family)